VGPAGLEPATNRL